MKEWFLFTSSRDAFKFEVTSIGFCAEQIILVVELFLVELLKPIWTNSGSRPPTSEQNVLFNVSPPLDELKLESGTNSGD